MWIRALIFTIGLQILAMFLFEAHVGNLMGFRPWLGLVGELILCPRWLTVIATNDFRIDENTRDTWAWIVQIGFWFALIYALLYSHLQRDKKIE